MSGRRHCRRTRRVTPRDTIAQALAIVAAIAAVVTTIWLIRTGHAGAESRWKLG